MSGQRLGSFGDFAIWGCLSAVLLLTAALEGRSGPTLQLKLQSQIPANREQTQFHTVTSQASWDPHKTALVVCDMWNQHWCRGASRRVAEMAPRMNEAVQAARERGVLIIHCPSSCMDFYRDTPQRHRAQQASAVETEIPLQGWCHLDADREGALPIDDSDGGCDCDPPCPITSPWKRQIETIQIAPEDAITDSAEAFYLMRQRGIENVMVMGVHTNMCVLGRPFSIRQLVYQGLNVVLVRDLTDTMYNSRMPPFVSHHGGTDRVVAHIQRHWCPTITSDQLAGEKAFRFHDDHRPQLVIVIGEDEYHTRSTLPAFATAQLEREFRIDYVFADRQDSQRFPGIEIVGEADVILLSIRRRALPRAQLAEIRKFVAAGKSIVALRTSSHAFHLGDRPVPEGADVWPEFDAQVLGGNYHGHYGNRSSPDSATWVRVVTSALDHPILKGVPQDEFQVSSTLYRTSPLTPSTTILMLGRVADKQPLEPVAWTHRSPAGGRVFYTSLGHPGDFRLPTFQLLLANAVRWAAGVESPAQRP